MSSSLASCVETLVRLGAFSLSAGVDAAKAHSLQSRVYKSARLPVDGFTFWFRDGSKLRLIGCALIVDDAGFGLNLDADFWS